MQQEKEQLLAGKLEVKEAVNIALFSVIGLEPQEKDQVEHQVEQLTESIQQLKKRIANLELSTVPNTS
jgi:hypothetical protein